MSRLVIVYHKSKVLAFTSLISFTPLTSISLYLAMESIGFLMPFMFTRNALAEPNLRNMSRRIGM